MQKRDNDIDEAAQVILFLSYKSENNLGFKIATNANEHGYFKY
jgi:hypothetical protein